MDKTPNPRRWLAPAILAAFAVLMRVPDFFLPVNRDSGLFAYGGWRILHGALPYVDFWDNKLPGVFYINALAIRLFGASQGGIVIFQMIYGALTALAFYAVARRLAGPKAALAAGLLFVFYQAGYGLAEDGNYTESYIALPVLLAVLLTLGSRSRARLAAAGALVVAAGIIKQPAALILPALLLYVLMGDKRRWADAAVMLGGAAVAAGAFIGWMAGVGILHEAVQANIVFNRLYFRDAYTSGLSAAKWNLYCGLNLIALPLAGGLAGLLALRRRTDTDAGVKWLLCAWFVLDLVGLAMGGRFYNHYFIALLPSAFLLTAVCIDRPRKPAAIALAAAIGLMLLFGPMWTATSRDPAYKGLTAGSIVKREVYALDWIFSRRLGEGVRHPTEQVAQWIDERTSPSDTIYIWCWDTRIAFLAQREIASRYLHTHPLGAAGFSRKARIAELVRNLEHRRPKFIVDGSAYLPTTAPPLAGPAPQSTASFFRLDGYEPVQRLVARDYTLAAVVAGYPIYEVRR